MNASKEWSRAPPTRRNEEGRQHSHHAHYTDRQSTEKLREILKNLIAVETKLQAVLQEHRHGKYGFITREWGFTAPGGLGSKLGGKFEPWEKKLEQVKKFFWPIHAYEAMEEKPFGQPDPKVIKDFPPEGEELYGNIPLHEFLKVAPTEEVQLELADYSDYRSAAKLFLLLGTLSHLYGNSAPDRKTAVLPAWIEDPLIVVAKRLEIEPTLSGHFLVQENWIWKADAMAAEAAATDIEVTSPNNTNLTKNKRNRRLSKTSSKRLDRIIVHTILRECLCADRRYRFKIYPNCFIGSQVVDILVENGYVDSREEAVRLGRHINKVHKVFIHVTNDHELMDKHLFYRFRKKWQKIMEMNYNDDKVIIEGIADVSGNITKTTEEKKMFEGEDDYLDEVDEDEYEDTDDEDEGEGRRNSRLLRPSDLLRRTSQVSQLSQFSNSSRGHINNGSNHNKSSPFTKEVIFDRASSHSMGSDDLLQDASSESKHSSVGSSGAAAVAAGITVIDEKIASARHVNTPDNNNNYGTNRSSLVSLHLHEPASLQEIMSTIAIMGMVKVKDRRYRLRVYKNCFVASEMIDVLMAHECAPTRKDALKLAVFINKKFHLFEHVVDNHQLKDGYLFFRFTKVFQTMLESKEFTNTRPSLPDRRVSFSARSLISSANSAGQYVDENLRKSVVEDLAERRSIGSSQFSFDDNMSVFELEQEEFRLDNIVMLYPAFGNNHERVNQLVPACMGNALAGLPFYVLDIITAMRNVIEAELNGEDDVSSVDSYESRRLYDLLYKVAFSVSRCKEQFQQMSTDPRSRSFNSKYVSIKQTQPLSNGVLVRREKGGEPKPSKGTTGTQFPYFHLLDWLLGRFQFGGDDSDGLVAKIASVDETFPRPQREYIRNLSRLEKTSTLRGFMEALGRPKELLSAYNHLVECYSGEGGVLQAHCRKLYSYIHNNVQSSTSGTNHLKSSSDGTNGRVVKSARPIPNPVDNHKFATMMFKHMRQAAEDRWKLRLPPLMAEVGKMIYSTSESGGFTTVALDISDAGLLYEYGDVVKVLVPSSEKTTLSWVYSLATNGKEHFKLEDMGALYKDTGNGWGWDELWEALGWCSYEKDGGKGVPLEIMAQYIEQGQIRDDSGKASWVKCPLDFGGSSSKNAFATPPPVALDRVASLEPVSPRVYSVSGVETDRVFLMISKPQDGARHHGYEGMSDTKIERVHCSFSPATFFLVPPHDVNLVCIASGTGISPFAGLVDAIGARKGSYMVVHQCKSSDLFLANAQSWLDFTSANPGAVVLGYISGDRSRRNCPMRYVVRNGSFEETTVLRRHNACAYYFECDVFQMFVRETYKKDGLNLAYCCGGVKSAIEPLRQFTEKEGMKFEFTNETYGVPPTLSKDSTASQIGGTIVNLDHVSPIHPGGDQILHQLNDIIAEKTGCPVKSSTPDHSVAFYELHPHAYNLHRCLRTPLDADSDAFTAFLERQAMSRSVMGSMASKYAEVALSSPDDSKIVKIATELQSSAIRQQLDSGDAAGARQSAQYLEQLLQHVPKEDQAAERWMQSLTDFQSSFGDPQAFAMAQGVEE